MKSKFGPENAYEVLVQSVVDYAIYLLDREGRVSSWNPGAERNSVGGERRARAEAAR